MNSIKGNVTGGSVNISAKGPHAKLHNEGGKFKVFGKTTATMPKRQYIGESKELNKAIKTNILATINDIFKQFN